MVVGRANNQILFAYNLEAEPGSTQDTVSIRIQPISPETEASFFQGESLRGKPHVPGEHLPTVSGIRSFPAVKIGEAVKLDILFNPTTGEKIYDVLRPVPGTITTLSAFAPQDEPLSLKAITVRVNNESFANSGHLLGAAVRIIVPGHGAYILAASDSRMIVPNRAVAHVDGKTINWQIDGDSVSVVSGGNVLTKAEKGTLWVYHDAQFRSRDQPDQLSLVAADRVELLFPKK
jgi:hypothetical protein